MGLNIREDLIGLRFGDLTVISLVESDSSRVVCLCCCGKQKSTTKQRLKSGSAKSCGCKRGYYSSLTNTKHGAYKNGKNSPEYQSYIAMLHRCYNENRSNFSRYGGKGIIVEDSRWLEDSPNGYLNFLSDMGTRPEKTSLDRIDNELGYSKDNCRWSTYRIQAVNTKRKKKESSTSKYRGVSYSKSSGKFLARIGNGSGGALFLGYYATEDGAAMAYNTKAFELFGEDAVLNNV